MHSALVVMTRSQKSGYVILCYALCVLNPTCVEIKVESGRFFHSARRRCRRGLHREGRGGDACCTPAVRGTYSYFAGIEVRNPVEASVMNYPFQWYCYCERVASA